MNAKNMIVGLILLAGAPVFAALNGSWAGSLNYTSTFAAASEAPATVDLVTNETTMTYTLKFQHPTQGAINQQMTFNIEGQNVFYNGVVVGTTSETAVEVKDIALTSDFYSFSIKTNEDKTMTFNDMYCYGGATDCESMEGLLNAAQEPTPETPARASAQRSR